MITSINIKKFGQFHDYQWKSCLNGVSFSHQNIFYGRNYSGKTTLSRIFRCIEKVELHSNYCADADFSVVANDTTYAHDELQDLADAYSIRVYNTDFVSENLSWLHNPDGSIQPFTILGEVNVEIDEKIKQLEEKLGDLQKETGLLHKHHLKNAEAINAKNQAQAKIEDINAKLRNKARDIKNNTALFDYPTYQINSIKSDIEDCSGTILSAEEIDENKRLLKEEVRIAITKYSQNRPAFSSYFDDTARLIETDIKPSVPLTHLLDNHLLQEWVRRGMELHQHDSKECAFCSNPISKELWIRLDAHFNKESETLRGDLQRQIDVLENSKRAIEQFVRLDKNQFYSQLHSELGKCLEDWDSVKRQYIDALEILVQSLRDRLASIFTSIKPPTVEDYSDKILQTLTAINQVIEANNTLTTTLAQDQAHARRSLRLSEVEQFIKDIDYQVLLKESDDLSAISKSAQKELTEIANEVDNLNEQKRQLLSQTKDESRGAELVNTHLTNFFGHDELKLVSTGAEDSIHFKIVRAGKDVKNLSEGESSLISFCYFMARIEDEMKNPEAPDKLVIYIDDPISSLDNNHIFYMFSLIDAVIARPRKYHQLFISTHNLDFLKYLKRLTARPEKDSLSHFLIVKKQKQNLAASFIIKMPDHLRDYTTEFNYLFKQIYWVYADTKGGDKKKMFENTYNELYNLPNNMRKFLECYLFYKYPNNKNPLDNLHKLFDGHVPTLVNRVVNEFSHLTYLDRGWKPIDVDEAEQCAQIVLDKIKEKDPSQYNALCESIDVAV